MNVNQQIAFASLQQQAYDRGHKFVVDDRSPRIMLRCSCGFTFHQTRTNAYARSAKIYAGMRQHFLQVLQPATKGTQS